MTMSSSLEGRAKRGEPGKGGHGEPTVRLPGMHRKEKGEIPANLPKPEASAQILLVLALALSPHTTGSSQVAWGHCEPQPEPSTQIQDRSLARLRACVTGGAGREQLQLSVFFLKTLFCIVKGKKGRKRN